MPRPSIDNGGSMKLHDWVRARWTPLIASVAIIMGTISFVHPRAAAQVPQPNSRAVDPWSAAQIVQPTELTQQLNGPAGSKPLVLCVGFDFLYQSAHVQGALLYGPGREPSGLKALQDAARNWPRTRDIVIYCGCCPMKQCPNLRPAFRALTQMGFSRIRVLELDHDFRQDWLQQGFAAKKSPSK